MGKHGDSPTTSGLEGELELLRNRSLLFVLYYIGQRSPVSRQQLLSELSNEPGVEQACLTLTGLHLVDTSSDSEQFTITERGKRLLATAFDRRRSGIGRILRRLQTTIANRSVSSLVIWGVLAFLGILTALGNRGIPTVSDFPGMSSYPQNDSPVDQLDRKLVSTILVYFMQLGFIAFEAGMVRQIYRRASAIKNLIVFSVSFFSYMAIGWHIQRYYNPDAFAGLLDVAFNAGFAATVSLILANVITERGTLLANALCSAVAAGFAYPLLAGIAFSGGALAEWGFVDSAGACAVHLLGGLMGLGAALWVGTRSKRRAWYLLGQVRVGEHRDNVPWTVIGAFFLWFGWLGFNSGNARNWVEFLRAITNTNVGACAGGFVGLIVAMADMSRVSADDDAASASPLREIANLERIVLGMMGGLVAVTANSGIVEAWQALVEALLGASVAIVGSVLLDRYLRVIDDPLGAISTHAGAGIVGVLCTAIFYSKPPVEQLGKQAVGCLIAVALGLCGAFVPCMFLWTAEAWRGKENRLYGRLLHLTAYEQQTGQLGTEIETPIDDISRARARLRAGPIDSGEHGDEGWMTAVRILALSDEAGVDLRELFEALDAVLAKRWQGSPEEQTALAAISARADIERLPMCVERVLVHQDPSRRPNLDVRRWNLLDDRYKETLIVTISELAESYAARSSSMHGQLTSKHLDELDASFAKALEILRNIEDDASEVTRLVRLASDYRKSLKILHASDVVLAI
jgi:ammonia channel protein AmtB